MNKDRNEEYLPGKLRKLPGKNVPTRNWPAPLRESVWYC